MRRLTSLFRQLLSNANASCWSNYSCLLISSASFRAMDPPSPSFYASLFFPRSSELLSWPTYCLIVPGLFNLEWNRLLFHCSFLIPFLWQMSLFFHRWCLPVDYSSLQSEGHRVGSTVTTIEYHQRTYLGLLKPMASFLSMLPYRDQLASFRLRASHNGLGLCSISVPLLFPPFPGAHLCSWHHLISFVTGYIAVLASWP